MSARPDLSRRACGVLLHPTSLPSARGGALGPRAREFADFLADCGQTWWQMLPVCPPDETGSPYASPSGFAGDPALAGTPRALREEQARLKDGPKEERDDYALFREREKAWLEDHALFFALKAAHKGRPWTAWAADLRRREPESLARASRELRVEVERHAFAQWAFQRRWSALRRHAASRGVGLIGDLPIYPRHDSADVWARQDLFQLDADGRPLAVAGVPPDYFSADGQLWGNPLYAWERHLQTGFDWWLARLRTVAERFDAVRLDHFIGFRRYWEVPAGAENARGGRWVEAPGDALFEAVTRALPDLGILAEDLGSVTPEVHALRDRFGFPGMRLGQFSFGSGLEDRPSRWPEACVAYTGTHDNDTTRGWYEDDGSANNLRPAQAVARERGAFHEEAGGAPADPAWAMVRLVWRSPARLALAPMQDLLSLPGSARMNRPGTTTGNWSWRMDPGALTASLAGRLGLLTGASGRAREGAC
ncbi:MAG: 4-alpha-glucanotransferase [Elusimicrobiota bacterium]|nr:4-alpha-glucanotransferase [Elusimicrobiota bacterium]